MTLPIIEEPVQVVDPTSTTTYELCGDEYPEEVIVTPAEDTDIVPASITVSPTSIDFQSPGTTQITVVVKNKNGKVIGVTPTYVSSDTNIATVNASGLVTSGQTGGAATISVIAGNVAATIVVTNVIQQPAPPPPPPPPPSGTSANEAEQPRTFLVTSRASTPSLGNTWNIHSQADWDNNFPNFVGGDKVIVDSGLVITGNYNVDGIRTGQDAGHYITIQTSAPLTTEGTRIRYANALSLGFPIFRTSSVLPPIAINPKAGFWRFINILFDIDPSVTVAQSIFNVGNQNQASTLADMPHDVILDCCCVHELDNQDCRKGVVFDGINLAFVDGDISNVKSTFDAQCVTSTNGPGPFKVTNNFLESSGENIAWGGATPLVSGLISSDIEVRRNHFTKNLSWFNGPWLIKNLYESKNSQRALIEANIFENCWAAAQSGFALMLWSANSGDSWATTRDQTVQWNWIRNVNTSFGLTAALDGTTTPCSFFTLKNNLGTGISSGIFGPGGLQRLFSINGDIDQMVFKHNSMFSPNAGIVWDLTKSQNQIWQDNLLGADFYPMFNSAGIGSAAWNVVAGTGSLFFKNVIAKLAANPLADNFFPATYDDILLVGGGAAALDPASTIAQMALQAGSPYHNAASDGTDIGVDTVTLASKLAGVE